MCVCVCVCVCKYEYEFKQWCPKFLFFLTMHNDWNATFMNHYSNYKQDTISKEFSSRKSVMS